MPCGKAEKKCSQNSKINCTMLPGILKNIQSSERLSHLHIVHYRFSAKSWTLIGQAIGSSKTLRHLAINVCNLSSANHLELLMTGMMNNENIERLDLSDNDLGDTEAMHVIQYMKK